MGHIANGEFGHLSRDPLHRQLARGSGLSVWTFDLNGRPDKLPRVQAENNSAIEEAEKAGFDLSLVEASLRLTPEERARQHDQALSLVLEFDRIRRERSEKPKPTTSAVS